MSGALNSHIIELVVIFQICTSNCWGLRQIAEISLNFTPICVKSWEGRWEGGRMLNFTTTSSTPPLLTALHSASKLHTNFNIDTRQLSLLFIML